MPDIFTIGIGVITALGGLYAAIAASKSANAAQNAIDIATVAQNRALRIQLMISIGEAQSESQLVNFMVTTLKIEYQSLFAFSGSYEHSSHKLLKEALEYREKQINAIITETSNFEDKFKTLSNASEEDIANQFLETQKTVLEIRRHKIELELELSKVTQQISEYRQRVFKK